MTKRSNPPDTLVSQRPRSRNGNAAALLRTITRQSRAGTAVLAAIGLVAAGATIAGAEVIAAPPSGMKAVGPASSSHGFPVWYEDTDGLRLEQCLDLEDPYCDSAFLAGETPDPSSPISFPGNWPGESFYFSAGANLTTAGGGKAVLVSALEATFANEAVKDGDQVVFGRVRFDIDFPGAGTYKVTHPYGVDTFTVTADEADDYRYVEDITPSPGNFALAMKSRINPFLKWDTGLISTENGNKYVGDPNIEHKVTGSALDTNFFRIEGPGIGGPGVDMIETDLFSVMGKVSTNSGVDPQKAVVTETAEGKFLDVFATTDAGDTLTVEAEGIEKTTLKADGARYFARIPLAGAAPTTVKITNASDVPVATKSIPVTDDVVISSAVYDTTAKTLTVNAASSDMVDPPALSLDGLLDSVTGAAASFTNGTATLSLESPPANVTVSSAGGDSDSAPVTVTGGNMSTPAPTTAIVTGPANVVPGDSVTLDASASLNAASFVWHQTDGTPIDGIEGATTPTVNFTAPAELGTLSFTVTATGSGGEHTSAPFEVSVGETIPETPAPAAPVAIAKATPANAMLGQQVTVSGADSINAESYAWTQTAGTAVATMPAAGESFSFAMPASPVPLQFDLTVTSPEGAVSPVGSVTVSQVTDQLDVTDAQLRTSKTEWRINGTASISTSNTVSVWLRKADGTKGELVGTSLVTAPVAPATLGDWQVRVRGGVSPIAGAPARLIIESSKGGVLDNVPYTSRR
jgi:hypothetical protein